MNDTMFWIVIDTNSMSAQGVQDDGEGYNEVLIQLSAKDKNVNRRGEVELVISRSCDTTNT